MIPSIDHDQLSRAWFLEHLEQEGVLLVRGVIPAAQLALLKSELEVAIEQEAKFTGSKNFREYGMLVACPVYGGALLKLANHTALFQPFEWVLGETCIMWVYTSSSMPPHQTNYSRRIHVDRPHHTPGYTEALGCLILLDDFTEENGATWFLTGSHHQPQSPEEHFFYQHADRLTGPAGSVCYFHLRIWHAGGENLTDQWRHALGIGMIRPYLKQRIDLPRALQHQDLSGLTAMGMQKLGFFAQAPSSIEEYYRPPEARTYRQRSEWESTE